MSLATAPKDDIPANALEAWRPLYAVELKAVDQVILRLAHESDAPLIGQLAEYIVASGGKRMRPVLTLLSAKLCGYEGDRHVNLAAAIEFIHTATLLHDDVVDESDLRRGNETANNRWGNAASVLVGDFLLSRAFQLMARDGSLEVLRILSDASAVISEGEVKQLTAAHDITIDETTYLSIITAKTAQLFAAACQVGAVVAEELPEKEQALFDYGLNLGIAFQITDDALDYMADEGALGKAIGDDFSEGKVTLPVILTYARANAEEQAFLERALDPEQRQEGDLAKVQILMQKYSALTDAIAQAQDYAKTARNALEVFEDCEGKRALLDLLEFAVNRSY